MLLPNLVLAFDLLHGLQRTRRLVARRWCPRVTLGGHWQTCAAPDGTPGVAIPSVSGSVCFWIERRTMTRQAARDYCASHGAMLATISSQAQNDAVLAYAGPAGFWIGLNDIAAEGLCLSLDHLRVCGPLADA